MLNALRRLGPALCLLFLTGLILVHEAEPGWSRAGGGGGFRSGGGGFSGGGGSFSFGSSRSSSRSGSRGGEFGAIEMLVLIIIIVIIVVGNIYNKSQEHHEVNTIRVGRRMQQEAQRTEGLEQLRGRDPGFAEDAFLERVSAGFVKLQHAWCNHDLKGVRPFISDGIFERFSLQLAEQKDLGVRDQMDNITVHHKRIVQIQSDQNFDTITVRITASATDVRVDAATGKQLSGSGVPERFTEYWSFLRRPGAKTLGKAGLIEGNCPNCGASLAMNAAAKCESCGSLVRSGEYDWVLAEITQASEWVAKEAQVLPGVAALQQRDPGFSVQHLEDRVSVLFYRAMDAERTGRVDSLHKVALEAFCTQFRAERLQPDAKGNRTYRGECAVGAVETLGIAAADDLDRALVQVRWCATTYAIDPAGARTKKPGGGVHTQVFVLQREHSARSDIDAALSSSHCPGCGAAQKETSGGACEYCGTALNSPSTEWMLEDIASPLAQNVRELRRQAEAGGGPQHDEGVDAAVGGPGEGVQGGAEAAAWMVQVMLADGTIDAKERQLIESYGAARGVPKPQIDMLITAMQSGQLEAPQPGSKDEAREWLTAMTSMALADGEVSPEEMDGLMTMARRLQFSEYDVKMLIKKTRRKLFQQAQKRLGQTRRVKFEQ